jgi:hypothetical protein
VAGIGRRLLVGAAEPRSPVRTLTTTRRSRGCFGDGCQGVLLVMGDPHGTDHRVGDRRGKNLRPAVSAIETARAFRSAAPDTGRTPVFASGDPSVAAFGAVADTDRLEGVRGDSSRRPPALRSAIHRRRNSPGGACRDPAMTESPLVVRGSERVRGADAFPARRQAARTGPPARVMCGARARGAVVHFRRSGAMSVASRQDENVRDHVERHNFVVSHYLGISRYRQSSSPS